MITIVFAHPWHGSFNKAILDSITAKLELTNKPYQVIDLNKDNFNPVLTEDDLKVYSKGESPDPLVAQYQQILKNSDQIVLLFPIWWHGMPAILKGFFDKVLLVNFSHNYEGGWNPLLKIKKGIAITTSESPTEKFRGAIVDELFPAVFGSIGINDTAWHNHQGTAHGTTDAERQEFLNNMADLF